MTLRMNIIIQLVCVLSVLVHTKGQCPPNAKADIVFVIDSSTSLKGVTNRMMKNFAKDMIKQWRISDSNVNVAIVPYAKEVVSDSTVLLNQFPNDKRSIIRTLNTLPRNGRGSMTGNALRYVSDVVLSQENGNRPDVPDIVITMSDGRGQDNVEPAIEKLQAMGATLYAVGFHPKTMMMLPGTLLNLAGGNINRLHLSYNGNVGDYEVMMEDMRRVYCDSTSYE